MGAAGLVTTGSRCLTRRSRKTSVPPRNVVMVMADTRQKAALLAARIPEVVLEAVLEWGQAVNEAEASEGEIKETATARARLCGLEVQRLAMGLAKTLRPNRSTHVG